MKLYLFALLLMHNYIFHLIYSTSMPDYKHTVHAFPLKLKPKVEDSRVNAAREPNDTHKNVKK